MIAYGICIGSDERYDRYARPGLALSASPNALVLEARSQVSIFPAYNSFLDTVTSSPCLEALVLLHDDVELRDPVFEQRVRSALTDSQAGILGAIGACGVQNLAWWEGEGHGRCVDTNGVIDFGGMPCDVDSVDGLLLVLSPWAVRNLRFDENTFHGFHGYDADICFQARAAGHRVRVIETELFHHTKGGFGNVKAFRSADVAFRRKWFGPEYRVRTDAAKIGRLMLWRHRWRRWMLCVPGMIRPKTTGTLAQGKLPVPTLSRPTRHCWAARLQAKQAGR
jgi:hypothetical protein